MYRFFYLLIYLPMKIFFPTKIVGRKKIPKTGVLIAANHFSNCDPVLLAISMWRKNYFIAKKELFKSKCSSAFYSSIGLIPINRQAADIECIKKSIAILKKDKILSVFPEGTRNKSNEDMLPFNSGIIMIALKAQKPIIPAVFIKKPKFFRFNKLVFGTAINFDEFEGKKLSKDVLDAATDKVRKIMIQIKNENTKLLK